MSAVEQTRSVVLVTGASEGIGTELARIFAKNGHDLCLVARNGAKLEALADELMQPGRPRPLVIALDLSLPEAPELLLQQLEAAGIRVGTLVNNAGYGLVGTVGELNKPGQLGIIDLNIRALVELTVVLLPQIKAARGGILNVASIAAYLPGPGMAIYYASKAFVRSFTLALWQEMRGHGVTVTLLNPGLTMTQFQSRAGMELTPSIEKMAGMTAKEVAEAGYAGLVAKRRVVVPGLVNRVFTMFVPYLPLALLLPAMAKVQGMKGKAP